MSLVLAIEPDPRQAARLQHVMRQTVGADLVHADTTERALAAIGRRVPDLVLVPSLLSPQEDAAIAGALRVIAAAANIRMLNIPLLADPEQPPAARGLFAKWRKPTGVMAAGCDPAVFAEQIRQYLAEAAAARAADDEIASEPVQPDEAVAAVVGPPIDEPASAPVVEATLAALAAEPTPVEPMVVKLVAEPPAEPLVGETSAVEAIAHETASGEPVSAESSATEPDVVAESATLAEPAAAEELLVTPLAIETFDAAAHAVLEALAPEPVAPERIAEEPFALESLAAGPAASAVPAVEAPVPEPLTVRLAADNPAPIAAVDVGAADASTVDALIAPLLRELAAARSAVGRLDTVTALAPEADAETTVAPQAPMAEPEPAYAELAASVESTAPVATIVASESVHVSSAPVPDDVDPMFFADAPAVPVAAIADPVERAVPPQTAAEAVRGELTATRTGSAPPPASTGPAISVIVEREPEPSAWVELVESLRADLDRLRQERAGDSVVESFDEGRARVRARTAAVPAAVAVAARRPKRPPKPPQDQWGLFDPEQCGFAALLAKLDEIGAREEASA